MSSNPSGGFRSVDSKQVGNLGRVEFGMRRECGAGCHGAALEVAICWTAAKKLLLRGAGRVGASRGAGAGCEGVCRSGRDAV